MKSLLIISMALFHMLSLQARELTDMTGRALSIPDSLERIMPYDIKLSVLLFPVAKDLMVAKALLAGNKKAKYISEDYNAMPEVDMKSVEAVLACNPQLIIAGVYDVTSGQEKYEKLQKRIHVPVVIIDLSIDKLDETYAFLAELLGNRTSCIECARFIEGTYSSISKLMKHKSDDANVYYSIGSSGLMTDPAGSQHTEVLDFLNLNNVAKVPIPTGGHANVNMEQVLMWNPDYIFTAGFKAHKNAYEMMLTSPKWKSISAIEKGQIYKVPSEPFGWFDHPPSVNRIPGLIWMSHIFCGVPAALAQEQITAFYLLFYHYELSPEEYLLLFE